MVFAAMAWSFGGLLTKVIPFNGLSIAALRGVIAAITIATFRRSFHFKANPTTWLAAFALFFTTILFLVATKLTSAANAILLQYTSLFFIILLNWLVDKERLTKQDGIAVLGIGLGIIIFFLPQLKASLLIGDWLALLAGFMFALVFYINKKPGASPLDSTYMGNLLSVFLLPVLAFDPTLLSYGLKPWILVIIMGVFQLGLGYILFALAIEKISATQSNVIATLEPILNPLWVYIVLKEGLSYYSFVGGLIVIISIIYYNYQKGENIG